MPPKKATANKIQTPRNSQDDSNDTFTGSQDSQSGRSKAKNYTLDECLALGRCTAKYHEIISKNSSLDKDKNAKQKAWERLKSDFDQYCKSQGIYVSAVWFFLARFDVFVFKIRLLYEYFHSIYNYASFSFQKCDRPIESLQVKFRNLRKEARTEKSETKRELVKTGNKPLSTRTIKALHGSDVLQQLRLRMGATASGFVSTHCEYWSS